MKPIEMNEVKNAVKTEQKQSGEQKQAKMLSLAEQVRLEKQIRADDCIKELSEAIEHITKKHNCKLVVQIVISEQGNMPQLTVVANDAK